MNNKICITVLLICCVLVLSACDKQNNATKKENESKAENSSYVSKSTPQATEMFDIEEYAAQNGYSSYFADAVNPICWLLFDDNGIAELTAVSGTQKVNTIPFAAISNYESTATPVFNRLTVHDKSGGKIEINLSPDKCDEVIKQIKSHIA